ncbi:response regulator transcription factor [Shimazuella alba]|uniref:Response regulator n=1 Tax=Shimazuella alba TaxID=2690964 RepID=A0A6I4VUH3_9BACL|nr:response regulator transcription factor [Shimazuella alba]MXQ54653.1 response regulator [Shimazuella alba]
MKTKILIADDETSITDLLSYAFQKEGYLVEVASDGEEAYQQMLQFQPDIAILDVMMPKMSGYEICQKMNTDKNIGIILLTAKNDITDKVVGIELGADDYITKPFDIREVLVRVKSILRRLPQQSLSTNETYRILDLTIDKLGRKVSIQGKHVNLTLKEFDLLTLLIEHSERVFTREELLDLVWGMDYIGGTRTVDIHIRRLRQKLGNPYDQLLQTLYGVGYKVTKLEIHNEA